MTDAPPPVLTSRGNSGRASLLIWAPRLTLAVMAGPVVAGLLGTVLPAFGYFPALGGEALSLDPFRALMDWPGMGRATLLSLWVGFASTTISLFVAAFICASWSGTRTFAAIVRLLAPLLSVPHAAAAFGLAFLIAPSGWAARVLSPWLTGWERPPDLLIVQDPNGIALILGLVVKEVPFLLLMMISALPQLREAQSLRTTQALGYGRVSGWLKTVFPRLYDMIRLPVYAVLAFSMSVIDVAMILGPNTPATLSVQVLRWMNDPDLSLRLQAAAGAVVQFGLVVTALLAWRIGERGLAALLRPWLVAGGRGVCQPLIRGAALVLAAVIAMAMILGLGGLLIWSMAGFWRFPDILPQAITLKSWLRHMVPLQSVAGETLFIATSSTALALALTLACLEAEARYGLRPTARALWLLYLPLIVPQIAFLGGLQTLAVASGVDSNRAAVVASHLVFVLPYVFLSLSDPFRSWDRRHETVARAMGATPNRVFWRVKLPMLLRPVLTAIAVGFAVSVGLYLPTLLAGAGRIQTLTTEAVALASGGDRRVIAVYALCQTAAAFLPFLLALALPAIVWRNRKGLRHA